MPSTIANRRAHLVHGAGPIPRARAPELPMGADICDQGTNAGQGPDFGH